MRVQLATLLAASIAASASAGRNAAFFRSSTASSRLSPPNSLLDGRDRRQERKSGDAAALGVDALLGVPRGGSIETAAASATASSGLVATLLSGLVEYIRGAKADTLALLLTTGE